MHLLLSNINQGWSFLSAISGYHTLKWSVFALLITIYGDYIFSPSSRQHFFPLAIKYSSHTRLLTIWGTTHKAMWIIYKIWSKYIILNTIVNRWEGWTHKKQHLTSDPILSCVSMPSTGPSVYQHQLQSRVLGQR